MLVIYESTIECDDCKAEKPTHNNYHHPHTEILFSFDSNFSGRIIESYTDDELKEEIELTGLSATQFAIDRCLFFSN